MAAMTHPDKKLFVALAEAAGQQVHAFSAQGVANTAWAFVTVEKSDEKLFRAWARAVERHIDKFNLLDLANTFRVFALHGSSQGLFAMFSPATR
eukprot:gnl/TRDRNA2_/TRDRNA2_171853_c6_seq2.p1 gnl/TRDRNA2_/TRDRNA2_171853_c6~~gnl/TRDRNA2_/TRDRNA2_171853_c6_seq2.p1  ORF type:complete len:102 (+),score=18.58 gnl/TRDRNA2_/TRDRNA2_171853_c6_seq2:26-307(+)